MKNFYTEKEFSENITSILNYVKKFGRSVIIRTKDPVDIEIVSKPKNKPGLSSKVLQLAGIWKDHSEADDTVKFSQLLREKASKRYN